MKMARMRQRRLDKPIVGGYALKGGMSLEFTALVVEELCAQVPFSGYCLLGVAIDQQFTDNGVLTAAVNDDRNSDNYCDVKK